MEEFIKKMRLLRTDSNTVAALRNVTYTDFDGRASHGVDAVIEMGADLGTLNPNEE